MTTETMDGISGKMKKTYLRLERIISKRKSGIVDQLESQICIIQGLCPRTAKEYLNMFSSLGIIKIYKNKMDIVVWKHNPEISLNDLLSEFEDNSREETEEEHDERIYGK